MKPIIEVQNISKKYQLGVLGTTSVRELLNSISGRIKEKGLIKTVRDIGRGPSNREVLWALKDVSFSVQPGEILGLIGKNGCGKSTLLKILSRITFPTEGRAVLRGKSSAC